MSLHNLFPKAVRDKRGEKRGARSEGWEEGLVYEFYVKNY